MHHQSKYVYVYNKILRMIKTSQFAVGTKLPSEKVLADQFEVSRVTLRTALSLLKEDGIIKSIHGQGSFVLPSSYQKEMGIEQFITPIEKSLMLPIEEKSAYYHQNDFSEYTDQLFQSEYSPYYTLNIWYKNQGLNIANAFVITTPKIISKFNVDLDTEDELITFLEETLYKKAISSKLVVTVSDRKMSSFKRDFIREEPLLLITEDLFYLNGERLAQCKYYIPSSLFRVSFNRYPTDLENRQK